MDQAAVADYVFEMSIQLATMADRAGLNLLAYLLTMVRTEADLMRGNTTPPHADAEDTED